VLFVTHDLAEAIAMADRVVIFTARPGRIKDVVPVPLPRPRDVVRIRTTPEFARLYDHLWTQLRDLSTPTRPWRLRAACQRRPRPLSHRPRDRRPPQRVRLAPVRA